MVLLLQLRLMHARPPLLIELVADLSRTGLQQRSLGNQHLRRPALVDEDVLVAHERRPDLRLVFGHGGGRVWPRNSHDGAEASWIGPVSELSLGLGLGLGLGPAPAPAPAPAPEPEPEPEPEPQPEP